MKVVCMKSEMQILRFYLVWQTLGLLSWVTTTLHDKHIPRLKVHPPHVFQTHEDFDIRLFSKVLCMKWHMQNLCSSGEINLLSHGLDNKYSLCYILFECSTSVAKLWAITVGSPYTPCEWHNINHSNRECDYWNRDTMTSNSIEYPWSVVISMFIVKISELN